MYAGLQDQLIYCIILELHFYSLLIMFQLIFYVRNTFLLFLCQFEQLIQELIEQVYMNVSYCWQLWKQVKQFILIDTQVVNSHLVCDPTVRQPGFDLPRQQWSLLNHFRTEQGHCGACRRKWRLTDTDLCPCGETQTMFHIVESCPVTKLKDGLSQQHSADKDAVLWLTSYGSW